MNCGRRTCKYVAPGFAARGLWCAHGKFAYVMQRQAVGALTENGMWNLDGSAWHNIHGCTRPTPNLPSCAPPASPDVPTSVLDTTTLSDYRYCISTKKSPRELVLCCPQASVIHSPFTRRLLVPSFLHNENCVRNDSVDHHCCCCIWPKLRGSSSRTTCRRAVRGPRRGHFVEGGLQRNCWMQHQVLLLSEKLLPHCGASSADVAIDWRNGRRLWVFSAGLLGRQRDDCVCQRHYVRNRHRAAEGNTVPR